MKIYTRGRLFESWSARPGLFNLQTVLLYGFCSLHGVYQLGVSLLLLLFSA